MSRTKKTSLDKKDGSTHPPLSMDHKDDIEDACRKRNMITLIIVCGFTMLGVGSYGAAYSQWIYVRFEKEVLGSNFSQFDMQATKDPCFKGNHSDSPFAPLLLEAQARSAQFGVWTSLCALIPSIFANLVLGAYADQIGRRIIFIVPIAGIIVRSAIVCAVAFFDLNVNFILIGFIVNGLTGDLVAFVMAMYVYTADNTSKGKNRSFLMILANSVNFICYYGSQFATGYYIGAVGYVWPMITAVGALCIGFILIVTLLRETLDRSKVTNVSLFEGIKGIFSFYFKKPVNTSHKRKDFILLGVVFFTYASALGTNITTIYTLNEPFCWGSRQIGYALSSLAAAQYLLAPPITRVLQTVLSDELLLTMGLVSAAANRFVFAYADYDWQIYSAYAVGILEASVLPIIRAILSRMVPKEKPGSLLASIAVLQTATYAASGAGLNELYALTVNKWRGLTFFVIGCITFLSALIMIIYNGILHWRDPPSKTVPTVDVYVIKVHGESDIVPASNGSEKLTGSIITRL